jgi:hypothetical protein
MRTARAIMIHSPAPGIPISRIFIITERITQQRYGNKNEFNPSIYAGGIKA